MMVFSLKKVGQFVQLIGQRVVGPNTPTGRVSRIQRNNPIAVVVRHPIVHALRRGRVRVIVVVVVGGYHGGIVGKVTVGGCQRGTLGRSGIVSTLHTFGVCFLFFFKHLHLSDVANLVLLCTCVVVSLIDVVPESTYGGIVRSRSIRRSRVTQRVVASRPACRIDEDFIRRQWWMGCFWWRVVG